MDTPSDTNPHDHLIREILSIPEQGAAYLRTVLPPAIAQSYDLSKVQRVPGDFVTSRFKERRADMLLHVPRRDVPPDSDDPGLLLYFLFEHLSQPDHTLPLRILDYEVAGWYDIVKARGGDARRHKLRLPPILPLVLYQGAAKWTVAPDIYATFGIETLPEQVREALKPYMVRQGYVLQDLAQTPDEDVARPGALRVVLLSMKHIRSPALLKALGGALEDVARVWKPRSEGELHVLEMVVSYMLIVSEYLTETQVIDVFEPLGERAKEVVMTAGQRLIEKGIKEGIEKGIEKGIKQGEQLTLFALARKMLREGFSAEQVARVTNLTAEQIRELES